MYIYIYDVHIYIYINYVHIYIEREYMCIRMCIYSVILVIACDSNHSGFWHIWVTFFLRLVAGKAHCRADLRDRQLFGSTEEWLRQGLLQLLQNVILVTWR